ncbi:MAG: Rrf2 family transcriptional regulator [Gemmatimonadota bacterium]
MRITTWTEYSLILTMHLARREGTGAGPIAARELAEQEGLPPDYVEQILLRLRRGDLVTSVRGARGGYRLARDPGAITVLDVMSAAEHQAFEVNCDIHPVGNERCEPGKSCTIRPVWRALKDRIDGLLGQVTLADLLTDESTVAELVAINPTS